MEEWKDIKGLERFYQISNLGNVRSKDRIIEDKVGSRKRKFFGKNIKPHITYGGYYSVQLRTNVKKHIFYIHRLVATHFCKGDFNLQINHINEDKLDNRADNLEFVTKSENAKHSKNSFHSRSFTNDQIKLMRTRHELGESVYSLSKEFNANSGTISNIINRKTYKNV